MRNKAAIARLRAYRPPPFLLWDKLPVSRRAAVLILLYADRRGDLRVVLTMRAASLRNFSGAWIPSSLYNVQPMIDRNTLRPCRISGRKGRQLGRVTM